MMPEAVKCNFSHVMRKAKGKHPGIQGTRLMACRLCRTSVVEDNPRVPKPEPAIPGVVSDEDLVQQGTVRIIGGDTPAREARMIAHRLPASHTQSADIQPSPY